MGVVSYLVDDYSGLGDMLEYVRDYRVKVGRI